jgi:hypothetical protein
MMRGEGDVVTSLKNTVMPACALANSIGGWRSPDRRNPKHGPWAGLHFSRRIFPPGG